MLAERGFYVVRYDNRDTGRSSRGKGRVTRATLVQRVRRPPGQGAVLAERHGRRRLRPDGPPRPRVGARDRGVDGRHDRADHGHRAAGPGALADQHHVDDRPAHGRVAAPQPVPEPAGQARRPGGLPRLHRGGLEPDRLARLPADRGADPGPRRRDLGPRHQRQRRAPPDAGGHHPAEPRPAAARPAGADPGRARPRGQDGPRLRRARHGRRHPGCRAPAHRRHGPRPAAGLFDTFASAIRRTADRAR